MLALQQNAWLDDYKGNNWPVNKNSGPDDKIAFIINRSIFHRKETAKRLNLQRPISLIHKQTTILRLIARLHKFDKLLSSWAVNIGERVATTEILKRIIQQLSVRTVDWRVLPAHTNQRKARSTTDLVHVQWDWTESGSGPQNAKILSHQRTTHADFLSVHVRETELRGSA